MSGVKAHAGQERLGDGPLNGDGLATAAPAQSSRRRFFEVGTKVLGGLIGLGLAIPGVAYLIDPLRRKDGPSALRALPVTLAELQVDVPRQFPIVEARSDAWVQYPAEPVGSVWLVKQPEGAAEPVVAFTSECPHLGCAINLNADGRSFLCPCHTSAFKLDGERMNKVPPRSMDRLEVEVPKTADGRFDTAARIRVKFERFRAQSEEKIPRV